MEFKQLLAELQSINPAIAEADVKRYLVEANRSASDIGNDELLSLAESLTKSGVLTTASGKLANSKQSSSAATKGKRQQRTQAPKSNALTKPSQEMDAYEETVLAGIDGYVNQRSSKIAEAIQEAPNRLVAKVQTILEEGECDPEHFRGAGHSLVAAMFGTV